MDFKKYGWFLSRNHSNLLEEAKKVFPILHENNHLIKRGIISGNHEQIDCLKKPFKTWSKTFLEILTKEVRKLIGEKGGKLQHLKLLIAPPGASSQSPHRDGNHKENIVVAFYLTPHESTNFCLHPYLNKDFNNMSKEEKQIIPEKYWNDYISFNCEPGDLSIFYETVTHFGPANTSLNDRYVLFSVWTPNINIIHKDQYQLYSWDDFLDITFFGSEKHRFYLFKHITKRPWNHYTGNKRKRLYRLCQEEKRKHRLELSKRSLYSNTQKKKQEHKFNEAQVFPST